MGGRVAVIADRVAWEEKQLIAFGPKLGLELEWVNDEALCLGGSRHDTLQQFDAVLLRSRSYTRGGLLANLLDRADGDRLVLNTGNAVNLCENKLLLRTVLHEAGVPVPDFRLVLSRSDFRIALEELPKPLVVKPVFGGMGRRVVLVRHSDTAHAFYDYIEDLGHAFEQACLAEPFLGERSVRCLVVGRTAVAAAEFESRGEDWRNNAAIGSQQRRTVIDGDMQKILDGVLDVLGEGIYGIDLFETPSGYVVNEVNHAPGFRAVATASGVDVKGAILSLLQEKLT